MTRLSGAVRALVLLAVFSAAEASAQSAGLAVLTGKVTDVTTQQPVADVVITATSPSLQGEEVVVTDPTGVYRIAQLPPGTYTLRLEKESFKPYSRGDIVLRADRTIRVNVELLPETLQAEEVVVVGKAPTIDVGSASTGVTISKEFIQKLPVNAPQGRGGASRSFEALAAAAPQARGDMFGVSLNGATSPENGFVIDGLTVNDSAFGINALPLTAEFVDEVNVITGGYLPEYGRSTGGILSVTSKSGSNEFRGSVWGTWTPGALTGIPTEVAQQGTALSFNTRLHNVGDFGAEIGGPILKDRLWFYAGVAPSFQRYKVSRFFNRLVLDGSGQPKENADGTLETERISGTEYNTFSDVRSLQYLGKLTYALSENHTLTLQVAGTPTRGTNQEQQEFQQGPVDIKLSGSPESNLFNTVNDSLTLVAKLNSSFLEKRLLVDATLGMHAQTFSELPIDNSRPGDTEGIAAQPGLTYARSSGDYHNLWEFVSPSDPGYDTVRSLCDPNNPANTYRDPDGLLRTRCPVDRWYDGGPGFIREGDARRVQGRVVGTFLASLAGRHVLKAGADVENNTFHSTRAYTGGFAATERLGGASWNVDHTYAQLEGPGQIVFRDKIETTVSSLLAGAFIQDSYSPLDRLTINAGVRYDTQNMYAGNGALAISMPSQLSPRIGAIYDFTGDGRSKIYANYAVYYSEVPLNIADRSFGAERSAFYRATNDACSKYLAPADQSTSATPQPNPNASAKNCRDSLDPANPYATENSSGKGYAWFSAEGSVVDPQIKPMATNEIIAGAEYQVFSDARLGLLYTHRSLLRTIEDMSMDNGTTYFISNPGEGIAAPFPKATRDYDAVTLLFDKTFADNWIAQGSYTLSRLYGNYNGLFVNATGQIDPNSNATFDLISLLPNQTGPLEADRTHQIKLYAAKQFVVNPKMAFTVGGAYTASSGKPINYLSGHPVYGEDEGYLLPRGSGGRTPWVHQVDARLGYDYRLTDTNVLTLWVDVFNMFNFQSVTAVSERYTVTTLLPIPNGTPAELEKKIKAGEVEDVDNEAPFEEASIDRNFKNPTEYQDPRQVRLGLRVTF